MHLQADVCQLPVLRSLNAIFAAACFAVASKLYQALHPAVSRGYCLSMVEYAQIPPMILHPCTINCMHWSACPPMHEHYQASCHCQKSTVLIMQPMISKHGMMHAYMTTAILSQHAEHPYPDACIYHHAGDPTHSLSAAFLFHLPILHRCGVGNICPAFLPGTALPYCCSLEAPACIGHPASWQRCAGTYCAGRMNQE